MALCSDRLGFLFASLLAFLAFLVSLAAMIVDFVLFGLIKHEINNIRANPAHATFANAIWLTLAATVILIFAGFIVCFECFGSRRRTRADRNGAYAHNGYVGNQMGDSGMGLEKRRWWRRNRSNKNAY